MPLLEAAIRQLRDRSMSLDIYVWLAWRLHRLTKPPRFHGQRCTRSSVPASRPVRQFKPRFTEALEAALAAYPEARVDLGGKAITLHPARPPIARIA